MNELLQRSTGRDVEPAVYAQSVLLDEDNDLARVVSQAVRDLQLRGSGGFLQRGGNGGGSQAVASRILAFVVLKAEPAPVDKVEQRPILTLMFVDIVQSTRRAEEMGDAAWRHALISYRSAVREVVVSESGREIHHAGDAFFATFERPAQAVRAARAIRDAVAEVGLEVRIGLHTGECERTDDGFEGVAVHIAARVAAKARAGEILVSRTVKDLVFGSGVQFAPARRSMLKGLSHEFRLFALDGVANATMACV